MQVIERISSQKNLDEINYDNIQISLNSDGRLVIREYQDSDVLDDTLIVFSHYETTKILMFIAKWIKVSWMDQLQEAVLKIFPFVEKADYINLYIKQIKISLKDGWIVFLQDIEKLNVFMKMNNYEFVSIQLNEYNKFVIYYNEVQ